MSPAWVTQPGGRITRPLRSGWPLGAILARNAHDVRVPVACCLCPQLIPPGGRAAYVTGSDQLAHLQCIGKMRPPAARE